MIDIRPPARGLGATVAPILRALPQWFGIDEATEMYIQEADRNPTLLALDTEAQNRAIGFLTLMRHSLDAAEIYVMGVLPEYHRRGVGKLLLATAEAYLVAEGTTFLQVKTLSDKHPDVGYSHTRSFYTEMGFMLLEEFPDLWGGKNPCWQMIKALR